jgi:hypothetical protein
MTQVGNLLRAAKAVISDPTNWHQEGTYVNKSGCLCTQAALNRAFKSSGYNNNVADKAVGYLNNTIHKLHPYQFITMYNDASTTSHTDIMNLFDNAAAMADTPS